MRPVIVTMIVVAIALAAIGSIRVSRQHDVLRYGYELSRRSERVRTLRESQRRLELELAMLSAPDRIRKLATKLGMTTVAPDRIRVMSRKPNKVARVDDVERR